MRSRLTVPVICSECGKELRGSPSITRGYHVSKHKGPDGSPCRGAMLANHQPKARVQR